MKRQTLLVILGLFIFTTVGCAEEATTPPTIEQVEGDTGTITARDLDAKTWIRIKNAQGHEDVFIMDPAYSTVWEGQKQVGWDKLEKWNDVQIETMKEDGKEIERDGKKVVKSVHLIGAT